MDDTTKRDTVIERFMRHENDSLSWADMHAMADRIVELEATVERQDRILATLREPSEEVVKGAVKAYWSDRYLSDLNPPGVFGSALRAAVAAAEQEVDRE